MRISTRLALMVVLGCCALLFALSPGSAVAAPSSPTPSLTVDPLYQASPISSAVRSIVLCHCPSTPCPQSGQGGEFCGGDPEIGCNVCRCVVALNGTHYCAQTP